MRTLEFHYPMIQALTNKMNSGRISTPGTITEENLIITLKTKEQGISCTRHLLSFQEFQDYLQGLFHPLDP